ncbi:hypothetical protein GIB67_014260 [Kingdonia uniflora]|uniref:DUF4378 domain-containing protein n=1 Tax=Kingdonia uniflora TaxID=39325 RepID=A0A7J7M1Y7_9MAGN|nr:hypothetical protein GIB67_014260 [Kingdonia uniflora]
MERYQQQRRFVRSHSATRDSMSGFGEGMMRSRKRVNDSKVVSDSSSCSSLSTEEDPLTCDWRQGRSKGGSVTLMKKQLAEEYLVETKLKQRPPNVVAKLMGLDSLPSQQPIHKPKKKSLEKDQQKVASVGTRERGSSYGGRSCKKNDMEQQEFKDYGGRSCKKNDMEQQEFKDVFEVLETSKVEKKNETKMDFIRETFMDVKRLSTNEKLQDSKEYHNALEVLASNSKLFLEYLQEPDSLFKKHLHDLQLQDVSSLLSKNVPVLESSNTHIYEDGEICRKSGRRTERNHEMGIATHSHNQHDAYSSSKVSRPRFDVKEETRLPSTRIVVLKPNLRNAKNATMPLPSPSSSENLPSSYKKHSVFKNSETVSLFADSHIREHLYIELDPIKHVTRGSRAIAREITRQMRHTVSRDPRDVSWSRLVGYAGDDSSGNDSREDFKAITKTSGHLPEAKCRYCPSTSFSIESSVSREAKKRLSERWKMTQRVQELKSVSRGSNTLGEMLAMPDRDISPAMLNMSDGNVSRGTPFGISSRDGWKDECARSLSRSMSLPTSSNDFGSPKSNARHRSRSSDRCSGKDALIRVSTKSKKENFDGNVGISTKINPRSKHKRHHSYNRSREAHTVKEVPPKQVELRKTLEDINLSEKNHMTVAMPDGGHEETIQVSDEIAVASSGNAELSAIAEEQLSAVIISCLASAQKGEQSSAINLDDSIPEVMSIIPADESSQAAYEVDSPASSLDVEQASPVSVLEPSSAEDLPCGSESFESVSADLHGLRMQLQLLKLEKSDAYSEISETDIVSIKDIEEEGSLDLPDEKRETTEVIEAEEYIGFLYLVDVLVESGFHNVDWNVVLATWYSPDSPVDPSIFEKLENKYSGHMTMTERKLLFDRINFGLMKIFQPYRDPHPWVKPKRSVGFRRRNAVLAEELWNILVSQEGDESDIMDNFLEKKMGWMDLEDHIDVVGRYIQSLLLDELVAEFVGA